jgi:hypothetical protein
LSLLAPNIHQENTLKAAWILGLGFYFSCVYKL